MDKAMTKMTVKRIALNTLLLAGAITAVITLILGWTLVQLNSPDSYVSVPLTWNRALEIGAVSGGVTAYFYLLSALKAKALASAIGAKG